MGISIDGTLVEIGNLEDGGRGVCLNAGGEFIELKGLSEGECIAIGGQSLGGNVKITVEVL